MGKFTIYFFNPRGQSEAGRLMLAHAGVDYNDVKFSFEEWPANKPNAPTGQIPYIDIDGTMYGQSIAIHNYIAREYGYYGKTNLECLAIDQIVLTANEFLEATKKGFWASQATKEEMMNKHYDEVIPKYDAILSKFLKRNESGFFVGDRLTLADFEVFDVLAISEKGRPGCLAKHPTLKAFYDKIIAIPKIKEFLDLRKDAYF